MIKRMGSCKPNKGIGPDQLWHYHTLEHAPQILKVSENLGIEKYTMTRLVNTIKGDPGFNDLTELWYSDEKSMEECQSAWETIKVPSGKNIADDWDNRAEENCSFIIEQIIVKNECTKPLPKLKTNTLSKLVVCWCIKNHINPEESWESLANSYPAQSMEIINTVLKKFVMTRNIKTIVGKENKKFDILLEFWWDGELSMYHDYNIWNGTPLVNGKELVKDIKEHVTNLSIFTAQEFVAKEYSF